MNIYNPFLPVNEYIPDGEPHVFGDRVYLYGSHDKQAGPTYCMLPYVVWSAPIDDLTNWTCPGIAYEAKNDPLCTEERPYMFAPDCVQGNDGRYYLYYGLAGDKGVGGYWGPISVAVSDYPDRDFKFHGHVSKPNGEHFHDVVLFDPAVMNDNGTIRLLAGTCYPFLNEPIAKQREIYDYQQAEMFNLPVEYIREHVVMGPYQFVLEDDMYTIKEGPILMAPPRTVGTQWEAHPFYEGPSIRKVKDTYYFIYSSYQNHELVYATSQYPDRDYTFRGTIISNGDVGYKGRKDEDRLNHTATTHGSIECINGQWYVFYHRQTHGTDYSRQACAEKIEILEDGTIPQVEITSCGLNNGPLEGKGFVSATKCCNLTNGHMPHGSNRGFVGLPMIYSDDKDVFITNFRTNTKAIYKYFDFSNTSKVTIQARKQGTLGVYVDSILQETKEIDSTDWKEISFEIKDKKVNVPFMIETLDGDLDILSLNFE